MIARQNMFRKHPTTPRVKAFDLPGHRVAYDCNSMELHKLGPGEPLPQGSEFEPMCDMSGVFQSQPYIVLNVTHRCNLACEYCFVQNYEEHLLGHMTFLTAVAALESFQNPGCANKPFKTGFFGGEPTLNMPVVRQVVDYVKQDAQRKANRLGVPIDKMAPTWHMTTNGVLPGLDSDISDFLIRENFSLIVSIDGPEDIHNAGRPARGGTNSYQATRAFLDKLKGTERAKRTTLRSTFSAHNMHLLERIQHLNELMWDGAGSHVSVEPLSLSENACIKDSSRLVFTPDMFGDIEREYFAVAEWMVAEVRKGRLPRLHHLNMPLKRLFNREPNFTECGAGKGGYVTVEPDGTICACHRTANTKIGHLLSGIDESKRAKWVDNRFYTRAGCNECDMRFLCGGGCRSDSLDHGYSICTPVEIDCMFKRIWYKCAMWMMCELTDEQIRKFICQPEPTCAREPVCA